ncbi:MAG: hypothetical protein U1E97_07770 [Alphaproteobacteria bacterium]
MSAAPRLDNGDDARRRRRNWAVAIVLAGLVVLFYAITIVRMGRL